MPKINICKVITFGVLITAAIRPFFLGSIFTLLSILLSTFFGSRNIDVMKSEAMTPDTTRSIDDLRVITQRC